MRLRAAAVVLLLAVAGCADGEQELTELVEGPSSTEGSIDVDRERSVFVDPQGTYEVDIDPGWSAAHGLLVAEIEMWFVAPARDGFRANVNILTQAAPGLTLSDYMDDTDRATEAAGGSVHENEVRRGSTGNDVGVTVYDTEQGGAELRHLATVIVNDEVAVVATLTALRGDFDDRRAEVEAYLLSLRPLQG
jgi:hypothetical protein